MICSDLYFPMIYVVIIISQGRRFYGLICVFVGVHFVRIRVESNHLNSTSPRQRISDQIRSDIFLLIKNLQQARPTILCFQAQSCSIVQQQSFQPFYTKEYSFKDRYQIIENSILSSLSTPIGQSGDQYQVMHDTRRYQCQVAHSLGTGGSVMDANIQT